jgi:hypothetical protein
MINPAHRKLASDIRKLTGQIGRYGAKFAELFLEGPLEAAPVARYQTHKSQLQEQLSTLLKDLDQLKSGREQTPKRVQMKNLPEPEPFQRLLPERKHFVDTIQPSRCRSNSSHSGSKGVPVVPFFPQGWP